MPRLDPAILALRLEAALATAPPSALDDVRSPILRRRRAGLAALAGHLAPHLGAYVIADAAGADAVAPAAPMLFDHGVAIRG
jgi:hypothetical protein